MESENIQEKNLNYTKRAVRGAGFVALMIFLSSVSAYILRIVLARKLSLEDYGLFYATFAFMMFFLTFRDMGLGSALIKFIPHYSIKKDYSKIKTIIVSAFIFQMIPSLILIAFFLSAGSYLAANYFHSDKAFIILIILSIYIFSSVFCRLTRDILTGFQDTKWYSLTEPLRIGITLFLVIPLLYFGFGIFSPVIAFTIGVTITFLVLLIGASKYFFIFKQPLKEFSSTTKQLFKFALPVIFTGLGAKVVAHLDVLLLTYFVPLTLVGAYNIILPTALLFLFFGKAVSQVLFPMTSELWGRQDQTRLSQGLKMIYTYSFLFTVPLIFTIFVFSDFFLGLIFGSQYTSSILAFRILLLGILCYIVAINNHTMISAIGKPIIVTKIVAIAAAINIILNIILIPIFDITGAAIATTISYIVTLILSTIKLTKFIKISPPWKTWLKILFSGIIFAGVIFLVLSLLNLNIWLEVLFSFIAATVVYFILIFVLKIIRFKEIKVLFNRLL